MICWRKKISCSVFALTLFAFGAAQSEAVLNEPSVKDPPPYEESIAHIDVTVKDLYGRQETRSIPITIYKPDGYGPWPLFVFNHGRATEDKRARQGRYQPQFLVNYLISKGFVVMVPMRVGYWETYGDFDPEYAGGCYQANIKSVSMAASDQVLAVVEFARGLSYVDTNRWLVGGQSMGGLTAVATVGRAPLGLVGGINFAGGAGGDPVRRPGNPCSPYAISQYWSTLASPLLAPMLWMYWQNDRYWGPDNPRSWHKAWTEKGGHAQFHQFQAVGADGHLGLTTDSEHWLPLVDHFLATLGFP